MIVYIQYTNPACYPPLQHSSRIFANSGIKVLFLGTGSEGMSNCLEFPFHENIRIKKWHYHHPGRLQKIHFLIFCFWSCFIAWYLGAKWIYASDMLSCPAAFLGKKLFKLKVIYHEHDSPNVQTTNNSLSGKLLGHFRNWVGKRADIVVFPNEARALIFRNATMRVGPIQIVWNVPSIDEIESIQYSKPDHPILFYHGSLNKIRLPIAVLDALKMVDLNVELLIAGYTAGMPIDYGNWYLGEARKRGLENRVRYLGPLNRKYLLNECSKATIGLAFMPIDANDINMECMVGASNKAFDYLACGLGLIVSDISEWVKFYVDPGYGVSCDPKSAVSISQAIKDIIKLQNNKNEKNTTIKNILKTKWNYEYQFSLVYHQVVNS